jgi:hypothetical protein
MQLGDAMIPNSYHIRLAVTITGTCRLPANITIPARTTIHHEMVVEGVAVMIYPHLLSRQCQVVTILVAGC